MKKLLIIVTVLCLLMTLASCTSESKNSVAGEYIPQRAYRIDDTGRTLQCDDYDSVANGSGFTKFVLNEDGTGYAVALDGICDLTWKDGTFILTWEGEEILHLMYTLNGSELTIKPAKYQTMPMYMEAVFVKQ